MKYTQLFIGFLLGLAVSQFFATPKRTVEKEYIVHSIHDTVTVVHPVAVAVPETIRIETFRLPDSIGNDSVAVRVPITSRLYVGEGYRASVSGFRPSLDSLVFEHTTITAVPKSKRWAVGIQTGIAATPKGITPFIGLGITYKLAEF